MDRKRLVLFALLAVALGFLFRAVLVKLVLDWWDDENYSHGFLVVPLAIWAVWRQRERLASLPVRSSMLGLVIVVLSILTFAAGTVGVELFLARIGLLGTLAGIVLFVWGWQHLKATSFAFLLLALAIPIPAIVFNQIAFPLQLVASRFGEVSIASCGIPVLREGNVIILASTSLEVAEACSGIRSLMSLLTLAVVWGYLTQSPMWLRWTLVVAAFPIAIFANGSRVAGTGIAAHLWGPETAEGFFHSFSGWMVFVVAGVLLFLVHRVAVWIGPKIQAPADRDGARGERVDAPTAEPAITAAVDRRLLVVTGCLAVAALVMGAVTRTEATPLAEPLNTVPGQLGYWEVFDSQPLDKRTLEVLKVDDYISRAYRSPRKPPVSVYVGYYRSQRQGQTMHSPLNCLPGSGWLPMQRSRVTLQMPGAAGSGGRSAQVNRLIIQKGLDRQLVLYWYQAHGRIVASEYWGKVYTVLDAIRLNRSDGSLVRVIVPLSSQDASSEKAAEEAALDFISAIMPALSKRLDG